MKNSRKPRRPMAKISRNRASQLGVRAFHDSLLEIFDFQETDALTPFFDRIPPIHLRSFPEIHRSLTTNRLSDWEDTCRIWQFISASRETGRILDIGSGDGWPAIPLAIRGKTVVGIDTADTCVRSASANADFLEAFTAQFQKMNAELLQFNDETFETVMISSAFEHCKNHRKVLLECMRVLIPGGGLVIHSESFRNPFFSDRNFHFFAWPMGNGNWQMNFVFRFTEQLTEKVLGLVVKKCDQGDLQRLEEGLSEVLSYKTTAGQMAPTPKNGLKNHGSSTDGERPQNHPNGETFSGLSASGPLEIGAKDLFKPFRSKVTEAFQFSTRYFSSQTLVQLVKKSGFANVRVVQDAAEVARIFLTGHNLGEPNHPFLQRPTFEGICSSLGVLACSTEINPALEDGTLIAEKPPN